MKNAKINWLSGLKGILSLFVFFHHYTLFFYNSILYGIETGTKTTSGIDVLMSTEPYGVILNGNFFVCVFITITSFIFAYKRFANLYSPNDGLIIFIKRLLYLFLNSFFCVIIYHLVSIIFSFVINNGYSMKRDLNIILTLENLFFKQWFSRNNAALGFLWPMTYFLFGPIVSYFISSFSNEKKKNIYVLYIILGIGFKYVDEYYSAFFFGVAIADIYFFDRFKLKERKTLPIILGFLLIIFGLLLGGYPSYAQPTNSIYIFIGKINSKFTYAYIHCIGAALLLSGLSFLKNKVLTSKIIISISNISLEIYLFHSMTIHNFSMPLFNYLNKITNNYSMSFMFVLLPTLMVLIALSIIYKLTISKFISNVIKKVINNKLQQKIKID